MARAPLVVVVVSLASFACSPPGQPTPDDELGDASESSSSSESSDTSSSSEDEASSSDSTNSSETGSSETDSTSSSETDSTSSSETDTGECELGLVACPDGTCVYDWLEFGCCAYGGECAAGCDPQDAEPGAGACQGAPQYAWTGDACEQVCPCQGSDCAAVYADPIACYEAHASCGAFDFTYCPFDMPVAPITIVGDVPGEAIELHAGAFGLFYGKGNGTQLLLRFGVDDLVFANYVAHPWSDPYLVGVLQTWAEPVLGVQQVNVNWGPPFEPFATGTLTITDLDLDNPDPLATFVTGTLVVQEGEWDLAGSFGLRHCEPLNLYAP